MFSPSGEPTVRTVLVIVTGEEIQKQGRFGRGGWNEVCIWTDLFQDEFIHPGLSYAPSSSLEG